MVIRLFTLILPVIICVWSDSLFALQQRSGFYQTNDYLEIKARQKQKSVDEDFDTRRRGRRRMVRDQQNQRSNPVRINDGNTFKVGRITNYKVLRDDKIVEVRNPKTGKRVITVMKASALPANEQNRPNLEYTLMELDKVMINVRKHDDKGKEVTVNFNGVIKYPLIGEVQVRGKTISEVEEAVKQKFKKYIHEPEVSAKVVTKSPRSTILVVGSGFREFQGHERILDILGADYEPSVKNIYDKVCVIRKYPDNSYKCIVIDMEHMFKYYDFSQNIPLKAGDIIRVKKIPPLFGYRFKFWWQQILSWLNEVDEMLNAIKSIQEFEFAD
jgi:hypothetical protein